MSWPQENWNALCNGRVKAGDDEFILNTVDCGTLKLPSGKLVCCDPFAELKKFNNPYVQIPAGEYKVVVTVADVSDELDGSHLREAYASLILDPNGVEVSRTSLEPTLDGKPSGAALGDGEFFGFGVDAGTACFTDAESIASGMPDDSNWYEELFDNGKPDSWFALMDDPSHIQNGLANIQLPESKDGNNLVLFHTGWGDGFYPVIGGYDKEGKLVNIHVDFFVVSNPEEEE